ncbi:hypothetical protein, partial [Virgibacillus sp. DJP39]|uniref:hypothetical protein n=1 Tax=Virgibacillus sp. DJP39 TaxID=3409790 RepID=UPI003BB68FBF
NKLKVAIGELTEKWLIDHQDSYHKKIVDLYKAIEKKEKEIIDLKEMGKDHENSWKDFDEIKVIISKKLLEKEKDVLIEKYIEKIELVNDQEVEIEIKKPV